MGIQMTDVKAALYNVFWSAIVLLALCLNAVFPLYGIYNVELPIMLSLRIVWPYALTGFALTLLIVWFRPFRTKYHR